MTDIVRYRGDTSAEEWQIKSRRTGAAVDITGYSFILSVNSDENPTNEDNLEFQITGVITDAATGKVEFVTSLAQSAYTGVTFTDGISQFYYDIQLTDASGRKRTYDKGLWTVKQDITKD